MPASNFCKMHSKDDKWQVHGRVDGAIPESKLREFIHHEGLAARRVAAIQASAANGEVPSVSSSARKSKATGFKDLSGETPVQAKKKRKSDPGSIEQQKSEARISEILASSVAVATKSPRTSSSKPGSSILRATTSVDGLPSPTGRPKIRGPDIEPIAVTPKTKPPVDRTLVATAPKTPEPVETAVAKTPESTKNSQVNSPQEKQTASSWSSFLDRAEKFSHMPCAGSDFGLWGEMPASGSQNHSLNTEKETTKASNVLDDVFGKKTAKSKTTSARSKATSPTQWKSKQKQHIPDQDKQGMNATQRRKTQKPHPKEQKVKKLKCTCGCPIHKEKCALFNPRFGASSFSARRVEPKAHARPGTAKPKRTPANNSRLSAWANQQVKKVVLEVEELPREEQKAGWKQRLRAFHPDKRQAAQMQGDSIFGDRSDAEISEVFVEIKRCYDVAIAREQQRTALLRKRVAFASTAARS